MHWCSMAVETIDGSPRGLSLVFPGVEMSILRSLVLAALSLSLFLLVPAAHADSVIYSFSGVNSGPLGDGLPVALQFTAPGFITSFEAVLGSQLDSCTNCLFSTTVPAVEFRPHDLVGDAIGFLDVGQTEYFYRFPTGAFSAPGTYNTIVDPFAFSFPGTLTVSVVAVPEPAMLTLLGAGFLGLIAAGRRKFHTNC